MNAKHLKYLRNVEISGVSMKNYPDFADACVSYAEWSNGIPLNDASLDKINENHPDWIYEKALEQVF